MIKEKKYLGSCCGNSFVVLDSRNTSLNKKEKINFSVKNIKKYKVDSALIVSDSKGYDASMQIFEKDGSESDSCGNGVMLIAYLLKLEKGVVKLKDTIVAVDSTKKKQRIFMNMKFAKLRKIKKTENSVFVKAGEPHIIYLVDKLKKFDFAKVGGGLQKKYREGVNVDAVQKIDELHYLIKTYERGVFAVTKSCGTGSLASYLAISFFQHKIYKEPVELKSSGGIHWVSRDKNVLSLETLKRFCKIKALN